jgi:hypothetical protein
MKSSLIRVFSIAFIVLQILTVLSWDSDFARSAMDRGVARFPVTERDQYRLDPDERLSKHIKKIGEIEGF